MYDNFRRNRDEVFSRPVRAGKRTYFFDVKATRDENLYIVITESKRRPRNEGTGVFYEKHKIFLYKEDLIKFTDGLTEAVAYVRENNPTPVEEQTYRDDREDREENDSFDSGASFEDLD
jgi:hypothetical protein